jgi:hypothetical protein
MFYCYFLLSLGLWLDWVAELTMKSHQNSLFFVTDVSTHRRTANSIPDYTLKTLYSSYFKGISASIELEVYGVTCCSLYYRSRVGGFTRTKTNGSLHFVFLKQPSTRGLVGKRWKTRTHYLGIYHVWIQLILNIYHHHHQPNNNVPSAAKISFTNLLLTVVINYSGKLQLDYKIWMPVHHD